MKDIIFWIIVWKGFLFYENLHRVWIWEVVWSKFQTLVIIDANQIGNENMLISIFHRVLI